MNVRRRPALGCAGLLGLSIMAGFARPASGQAKPEGEMRYALPIFEYMWPSGVGPRVAEPALMLINPYPWSAPLEEVRLKKP